MNRLGRVLAGILAVALTVFSLQAAAAEAQMAGRDFNHLTTGFPLTGGHATTPCETCHLGGVFKGTPKTCDGCHSLGKRVVATPKSTGHIVTDGPCDSCHFNTSTFLGARFNHGTALPGQCKSCHNGRQSTLMPSNHTSVAQMTSSCDQCHRTYAWLPASWNHVGVTPGSCANSGCHVSGSNQYYREKHTYSYGLMRTNNCDDCHNYVSWTPRHMPPIKPCSGCHDGVNAQGAGSFTGHMPITLGSNCTDCHSATTTASPNWAGAVYRHVGVIPGSCAQAGCHIAPNRFTVQSHVYSPQNYSIMMTTPACDSCHTTSNWTPRHITPTVICNNCHDNTQAKGPTSYLNHPAVGTSICTDCHSTTTISSISWAGATGGAPLGHTYTGTCTNCHPTPATTFTGATLHNNFVGATCASCHLNKGLTYTLTNPIQTKNHNQPKDCAASKCHYPGGTVGSPYTQWSN
jgi:hypothetical protein